jgi:hypothetical protein
VRQLSGTSIPDATSGFRAISRGAALKLNVLSDFTYTLETIIQAGKKHIPIGHFPISPNPVTRPSRLFGSTALYVRRSIATMVRIYALYEPLTVFVGLGGNFLGATPDTDFTAQAISASAEPLFKAAQEAFKAGNDNEGLRVVCMVTTMGVGITLDNVETIHVLDETWNPDDQEQLTDRAVNTTRNHQVTAFMYRSRNGIEEYINDVATLKADVNKNILDVRRLAYRASLEAK